MHLGDFLSLPFKFPCFFSPVSFPLKQQSFVFVFRETFIKLISIHAIAMISPYAYRRSQLQVLLRGGKSTETIPLKLALVYTFLNIGLYSSLWRNI